MRCWIKGGEATCKVKTATAIIKSTTTFDKTKAAIDKTKAMFFIFDFYLYLCGEKRYRKKNAGALYNIYKVYAVGASDGLKAGC